jgi:hypothetical protein
MLFFIVFIVLYPITGVHAAAVKIFPVESNPYGLSYEEHIKNFWKWQISIPADKGPVSDKTGERCSIGQANSNSSVFYLSGGGGGNWDRTCKVPAGKGILIPVMTVVGTDKEYPNYSVEELRYYAKDDQDGVATLYLSIDGTAYDKNYLDKFRTHTTDAFDVVFPENGLFGVTTPGTSKAMADGYYIITEPLAKGKHEIQLGGSIPNIMFTENIKYTLLVE